MSIELGPRETAFVAAARVGYLATVYPGGGPHVAPICPALDGDTIVLSTGADAVKVRNLRANPAASIAFVDYAEDWDAIRHVIVFGKAVVLDSGAKFAHIRDVLYGAFPQYGRDEVIEEGESACIEIPIERVAKMGFE